MRKEKNITEATISIGGEIYNAPYDVIAEIGRLREDVIAKIVRLQAQLSESKATIETLRGEVKTYKAGNVPVTQIISDNEGLANDIEELQAENVDLKAELDLASETIHLRHQTEISLIQDVDRWKEKAKQLQAEIAELKKGNEQCLSLCTVKEDAKEICRLQDELDKYRWIPVAERLPEPTKETHPLQSPLVWLAIIVENKIVAVKAWYEKANNQWWDVYGEKVSGTHWKPIILPKQALNPEPATKQCLHRPDINCLADESCDGCLHKASAASERKQEGDDE